MSLALLAQRSRHRLAQLIRRTLDGQGIMKNGCGLNIIVAAVLVLLWPSVPSAQGFSSDEEVVIASGVVLSAIGSGVCSVVNGDDLAHNEPSLVAGVVGLVFGVSTLAFLGVAESQDDMDVTDAGMLLFGTVGLVSAVLGSWSIAETRSNPMNSLARGLSVRPSIIDQEGANYYGVGLSVVF